MNYFEYMASFIGGGIIVDGDKFNLGLAIEALLSHGGGKMEAESLFGMFDLIHRNQQIQIKFTCMGMTIYCVPCLVFNTSNLVQISCSAPITMPQNGESSTIIATTSIIKDSVGTARVYLKVS